MKYSELDHGIKMHITDSELGKVPEEVDEEELEELEKLGPTQLWEAYCDSQMIDDHSDLHDAHEAIFQDTTALDILDKVYTILTKYPPKGMNTDYMNVLAATGRKDELSTYLDKFLS